MSNTGFSWEVLVQEEGLEGKLKTFSPDDIALVEGTGIDYDADERLKPYVERKWEGVVVSKISAGEQVPTNGSLVRISQMPEINSEGKVELHLGPTDYMEYMTLNFADDEEHRTKDLPFEQRVNVMNSIAIVVTADEKLAYCVRGQTASFPGKISGWGRAMNNHEEILETGPTYLFDQVKNAVFSDTGMENMNKAEEISENLTVELGGFAYRPGWHMPVWIATTSLEAGEMKEAADKSKILLPGTDQKKYPGIGFVPLEERDYDLFFIREAANGRLNPEVLPLWDWLGMQKFGEGYEFPIA